MATIQTNLTCELQNGSVAVQYLNGVLFTQDVQGNQINVAVYDGGEPATISGTVSGNVIRSDGGTVAVTGGSISGNVASITLPAAAYAVPGVASIIVKLSTSGVVTTLAAVVANIYESSTSTAVDPGTVIPSVQTLINQINTAVATIPVDYSNLWTTLAPAFSTSATYAPGQYVTYNQVLYRFTAAHTGNWSASDVVSANIGNDLSDLKNAIIEQEKVDVIVRGTPNFTVGKYVASDGTLADNMAMCATEYISVTSGSGVRFYYGTNSSLVYISEYDTNKDFVKRYGGSPGAESRAITLQSTTKFVRFGFPLGYSAKLMKSTTTLWEASYDGGIEAETEQNTEDITALQTAVSTLDDDVTTAKANIADLQTVNNETNRVDSLVLGEPDNYTVGKYVTKTGELADNISMCATDYIPVTSGVSVRFYYGTYNSNVFVAEYDTNKGFVKYYGGSPDSESRAITLQSTTKYIRFGFNLGYSAKLVYSTTTLWSADRSGGLADDVSNISFISRTVRTIAHRGNDIDAPQCTAPAYIAARKRGLTIAENDVWNSADGYLVMWHDTNLSRLGNLVDINGYLMYTDGTNYYWVDPDDDTVYTWNGTDYVSSSVSLSTLTRCYGGNYGVNSDYGAIGLNLAVLKRIDFGVYKGQEFAGTQLLTFAEWVLLCKQLGMEIYIDRKIGYTQEVVEELVATVKMYGMLDFASWINLNATSTQLIRSLDPNARCGTLQHPTSELITTYAPYNTGRGFFFNGDAKTGMTESAIQLGLNAGFGVEVWYVDYGSDTEETIMNTIRTAVSYGVQGITLDRYRVDEAFNYLLD